MYENHTQNCLEDEFLGPHCTCMARPMENEGPKRRAEVCALADQLGLILQRRIAMSQGHALFFRGSIAKFKSHAAPHDSMSI